MTDTELANYLRETWPIRSEFGDITTKQRVAIHLAADRLLEVERLQAKVDALMLEYCPAEMTPEQLANWERHQRAL